MKKLKRLYYTAVFFVKVKLPELLKRVGNS